MKLSAIASSARVAAVSKKLKSPAVAAVLTGVEIAGTAVAFGVAETVISVAAAYAAYRALSGRAAAAPDPEPDPEILREISPVHVEVVEIAPSRVVQTGSIETDPRETA
jgi:hypothetical protein